MKECVSVSVNDKLDFDHDGCDLASANSAAATVIRQLAAQLESAGYRATRVRTSPVDAAERTRRIDFALVHLASVMSEMEVIGLVNALRHAANTAQDDPECEFCGTPTQPWAMLTSDSHDDDFGSLIHHSWDQYGYALCKNCHMAVRQSRWQAATQM
jgi:CheY-like chemotaxis protein